MTKIVILGAGLAGMSAAYEFRDRLGAGHAITIVDNAPLT